MWDLPAKTAYATYKGKMPVFTLIQESFDHIYIEKNSFFLFCQIVSFK